MKQNWAFLKLANVMMCGIFLFTACEKDQLLSLISESRFDEDRPNAPKAPKGTFFFGLSPNNELVGFRSGNPLQEESTVTITGLMSGEKVLVIDFRPATGQLYGVTNMSRIYIINTDSGAARALSTTPFTPVINGTLVGFDFNPTVDRIRLVTNNEQNLRLNPETGLVAAVDGNLNPGDRSIVAVAIHKQFCGSYFHYTI